MPCAAQGKEAMEEDSPSTASAGQTQHVTKTRLTLLRAHSQVTPQCTLKGCEGEKLGSSWGLAWQLPRLCLGQGGVHLTWDEQEKGQHRWRSSSEYIEGRA